MTKKILLVEDDALEAMDIKRTLESVGYSVVYVASRGEEAVDMAFKFMPDIIIMDILLKGDVNGIEAASMLKDVGIPVIYLTAISEKSTVQKAKLTEPYGYLIKPYDFSELKFTIELALYKFKQEKKLKKSEVRFRSVYENSFDAILLTKPDGTILSANPAAQKMFGMTEEEIIEVGRRGIVVEDENLKRALEERERKGKARAELMCKRKDGSTFIGEVTSNIFTDDEGNFDTSMIIRDVTEHKIAEEKLQKSEEKYRNIFEESFDGLFITSPEGKIVDINKKGIEMFGYNDKEEVLNLNLERDVYSDPNDRKRVLAMIDKDGSAEYEIVVKKKNGERMITQCSLNTVKDENGDIISYRGIIRDITKHKEAENEIRLANLYNRSLIEASLDPLVTIGQYGEITDVNEATEAVTGVSRSELIGTDFSDYFTDPLKAREGYKQVFKEGFVRDYPLEIMHRNGQVTPVLYNASVYKNESGEVIGVFAAARDIAERKNAENELKKSLKEKEVLLKEIHHRVKNNMQIISSLLSLQKDFMQGEEADKALLESRNRVKSMAMVHEKLYKSKNFTRINISELIERLVADLFLTYNIPNKQVKKIIDVDDLNLNIETAIPCGLIISELVTNSLKYAFPHGKKGKLTVSLEALDEWNELTVSDDGIGFPEDLDYKKPRTLGLQLVNKLVDQLDGEIILDRIHGTSFKICFKEIEYKNRV